MKPLVEFLLTLVLLLVGGCSAIAGIVTANIWIAICAVGAILVLVGVLLYSPKAKQ